MSHVDAGPLPAYNSLMDPHLAGYFGNRKMRRHLRKQGLITRNGDIVSENTYRLNMARKEHKKHVRDMLAQAIVHKTLDMERARQVQIKRKLEEIAKIELVRRVQNERGRKGDEDVLPYLTKGELNDAMRQYKTGHPRMVRPASVPGKGRRGRGAGRPVSAPSRSTSRKGKGSAKPGTFYVDEDGFPVAANERQQRSQSAHASRKKASAKYPTDEIDDRHLYALNQRTLHEYTQLMNEMDQGRGPSPYILPQLPMMESMTPRPPGPPKSNCPIKKSRRRIQHTDALGKPIKIKEQNKGYLLIHRTEPALKHQERVQTLCDVTMHYFGSNLKLDYERTDPRDEVMIEQQHCGGNTLIVFREHILPHSDFTFTSRRHRGYPFSLTFYINGVQDCRLSTCCEYKHARGARIGGKAGKFAVLGIQGAAPCYRCQINESMKNGAKKKKKKERKEKTEEDEDKENEKEDKSESEDDEYDDDFSDEEGEDEETKKEEEEVDVRGMTDDEDKNRYEAEVKSDRTEDKEEADDSGSSSSSSSSSSSGSDSDSSTESGEEDDNKSEAEIKGLKDDDEADKSQRGETNSSAEVDAAASPREGAVSPTPDSELPKITVTPQGDSPRSQTSGKTREVENANETPRPVTRMQKRDYSTDSDQDDKKDNDSDTSSSSSRSSRSSESSRSSRSRSRSSSGSRSRSSSKSGSDDERSKSKQRDSDSD